MTNGSRDLTTGTAIPRMDSRVSTETPPCGIDKIGVYPAQLAVSMERLCAARGEGLAAFRQRMLLDERSLNPPWEDPVTMAVNAADAILDEADRASIELLIVGTESGVDQEKPISTWIHRHLRLGPNCRNLEVKHACYGATGALQLALPWLASNRSADPKALIISTDQSRMHLNSTHEFVGGAAATAVLLTQNPRMLEIEIGESGYWTSDVWDLARPTSAVEIVDDGLSLLTYLEALEGAYRHHITRAGRTVDFDGDFRRHVYHAPFGGLAMLAHKRLAAKVLGLSAPDARAHFERKTLPSLRYLRRIGSTYGSSTFIALLALLAEDEDVRQGDRIAVFGFGSGACGEFYSVRVAPQARDTARQARLPELLDARQQVTVEEYECIERRRANLVDNGNYDIDRSCPAGAYDTLYAGRRLLTFEGLSQHRRRYAWS